MFRCREKELQKLNDLYTDGKFECLILYGRRRVGKTALINEFIKDKPVIRFSALNGTSDENLSELSRAIGYYRQPMATSYPEYCSFADAFSEITHCAESERLIFVIDEYPYLADAEPSISSRLQHIIDHEWVNTGLFIILCGSSMSFMEEQVLGYESPLYGRRTAQIRLMPMDYYDTARFCSDLSPDDKAVIYGITGGIPLYINKLDVHREIKDALLTNLFETSSYLYEEPENLLKQELREPALYNSIITAIATGRSRLNDIALAVGTDTSTCGKYIRKLNELGIIEKVYPIGAKNNRKSVYRISDNLFRFWYRFVRNNQILIQTGRISNVYESIVGDTLSDYMGLVFEKMCREYLLYHASGLPGEITQIGEWWGTDPETRKEVQIDITASFMVPGKEKEEIYLIGSCKYRSVPVGVDELKLLQQYASCFTHKPCIYFIFSRCGFTDALRDRAAAGEVRLVSMDEMYI